MDKKKPGKKRFSRPTVKLKGNLEKRLAAYALAAGAAGVGALVGTPQAEAQVIFTNTWIPFTSATPTVNIDLNNDGVADFVISNSRTCTTGSSGGACRFVVEVVPQNSQNAVFGAKTYAPALASGVSIGSNGQFLAGKRFMARAWAEGDVSGTGYGSSGTWRQATNLFLGVKFTLDGEIHYGWIRVDLDASQGGFYGAISGYAYQSTANQPIETGQKSGSDHKRSARARRTVGGVVIPGKSSLGQLAAGAVRLESGGSAEGMSNGEGK
jgi:hypothetical protein